MSLSRCLAAEGVGSLLLAAAVVGSGIMAERLAGGNAAIALLANTAATVAALMTLIALLGPPSGAHFNPAVSLAQALRKAMRWQDAGFYVAVQVLGCCRLHRRAAGRGRAGALARPMALQRVCAPGFARKPRPPAWAECACP
jgi:hypothetical protein